jgi:hypothetical protein
VRGARNRERGDTVRPVSTLRSDGIEVPRGDRLRADHPLFDEILGRHRRACDLGLSMYRDPASGYMVMTAPYLAERGYCCSAGCRHCPYE